MVATPYGRHFDGFAAHFSQPTGHEDDEEEAREKERHDGLFEWHKFVVFIFIIRVRGYVGIIRRVQAWPPLSQRYAMRCDRLSIGLQTKGTANNRRL
eukprot:SAG11_NODE_20138_length_452_cov_0.470255_1_plen_97_part_00